MADQTLNPENDNFRLSQELTRREVEYQRTAKIQSALYQIAEAASAVTDMQDFYVALHRIIGELMYAENFFIALYDAQSDLITWPYYVDTVDVKPTPIRLVDHHGATGWVLRQGKTIADNDGSFQAAMQRGEAEMIGTFSDGIASPLKTDGKTIGVLNLQSYKEEIKYSLQDIEVLNFVGQHISTALMRARALEETRQRNAELAILNSVGEAMAKTLDVKTMTRIVGDKVREIFRAEIVDIQLFDVQTKLIHSAYNFCGDQYYDSEPPWPLGEGMTSKVIISRQPLLLNNVEEMNEHGAITYSAAPGGSGEAQSYLGVPIVVEDRVVGVVDVQSYKPNSFDENNLRLLQTLSSNMGVAIENARLFEETEQRAAELAIINSVQEGLASKLDMQAIYDLVGDKIREILHNADVGIRIHDPKTNLIHFPYAYENGERIKIKSVPLGEQGFGAYVMRTHETLVINEHMEQEAAKYGSTSLAGARDPKSQVLVPLMVRDKARGLIEIVDVEHEKAFSESDVRLLQTLANSMSIALENARLFEAEQQRAAELTILNSVQEGLASKLEMQAIYDLVGDKISEIFDTRSVQIRFYDRAKNLLQYSYVLDNGERLFIESGPLERGLSQYVIETRQPFVANTEMQQRLDEIGSQPLAGQGQPERMKSLLAVPTTAGNEATGLIFLGNYERENAYSESDVALLTTLASSMSVALENARLFDETQRLLKETDQRAQELAIINTVQTALASKLDFIGVIYAVGDKIHEIFPREDVLIGLVDRENNMLRVPYIYSANRAERNSGEFPLGQGLANILITTRQPLLINTDFSHRGEELGMVTVGPEIDGPDTQSWLGVPIIVGEEVIGGISLNNTDHEYAYSDSDVRLLQTLAGSMGVALENARLFDESQRQREYFESVVEQSPVAIVLVDPQQNVTSWNPAAERLFGYTSAEAVGHDLDDLVANSPEVRTEAAQFTPKTYEGKTHHAITKRTRRDGTLVDVELLGEIIEIAGHVVGGVVLYHDITDVEHARQEAIAANQAKSAFLANMSHELRTPLNAIIGFTRIVRRKGEEVLPQKQTENLDKVLTSAEHLLSLINSVLDISKIEAGRMDVLPANFRIGALIDLCANTSQPLLKPGVMLEKQVDEHLNIVYSDQDKIRQIVLNLLANAAKFTSEGKVVLTARPEDDASMSISVADTGIGIDKEVLPRIFDEFQQADSSTTREYGGTGLGLTISRSLAHLLGGELTAESEPGKGSTFTLTIPVPYQARATAQPAENTAAPAA